MRFFFLIFSCFISFSCFAKLYPGVIYLANGIVIEANIEPPKRPNDLFLSYSVEKGKLLGFKSSEVKGVYLKLNKNENVYFAYLKIENDKKQKSVWAVLSYQTKKVAVYTTANEYYVSKNNYLSLNTSKLNGNDGLTYYLNKSDTEDLFRVFEYRDGIVDENEFYQNLSIYLGDEPRLVNSLSKKEYVWNEIFKICEIYSTLSEYRDLNTNSEISKK